MHRAVGVPSTEGSRMQPGEFAAESMIVEMERLREQLDEKTSKCVLLESRLRIAEAEIKAKDEKLM